MLPAPRDRPGRLRPGAIGIFGPLHRVTDMAELDAAALDRAAGMLLASAVADALVAGGVPMPVGPPRMSDGSWTEATALAVALVDAAVSGVDLREHADTDRIGAEWWAVADRPLLWAGPLALAYLGEPVALVEAASALSAVSHLDPEVGEACALWALAIRHSVLTGELDARVGLAGLPEAQRDRWAARLAEAEAGPIEPSAPDAVRTVQAAWSVIMRTPVTAYDPEQHLTDAIANGVALGRTVTAAAVGALVGAVHGAAELPLEWAGPLHGADGLRALDLVGRAQALAAGARVVDDDILEGL